MYDHNAMRGHVRGIVVKKSGALRFVVEDERGMLMIFNDKQLRSIE